MIKILTWNINGIRAIIKKNNIIDNKENKNNTFINYIKTENPDIICLNELKICKTKYIEEIDNKILPEYQYKCFNFACNKKGYAGVCIFSKIKPLSSCIDIGDDSTGRYSFMEFEKFIIICVYVMNAGEKLKNLKNRNKWDEVFLKKIQQLQKKYKKDIIITGDFNVINRVVDTHNYDSQRNKIAGVSDIEMSNFQNFLKKTKLIDTWLYFNNKIQFSYFTYRFDARKFNKGMRIDYFFINKNLLKKIKKIDIKNNIYGSDHLPLIMELQM